MNKKGDLTGLLYLIVMIAAFAIFLLIVGYITPQITEPLQAQIGISEEINNSLLGSENTARNTLPTVWLVVFTGLLISLMATAYFVPTHPIFIVPFMILLVIAILVSVALSNAYEALTLNALLAGTAEEQSLIGFLMINLPYVSFIIGLITLVISFAKPSGGGSSAPA